MPHALDEFVIVEAEFRPYWAENGVTAPPGGLVSSYAKDGQALLAVVNTEPSFFI